MDRRDGWIAYTIVYLKNESRDWDGGSQRDSQSMDQACREQVISCLMDSIGTVYCKAFAFACSVVVHANMAQHSATVTGESRLSLRMLTWI